MDAHQHFWHYSASELPWMTPAHEPIKRSFLPADLQPLLAAAGLSSCIAVQARQSLQETSFLLGLAEQHDFIEGVVGWLDLRAEEKLTLRHKGQLHKGANQLLTSMIIYILYII